MTEPTETLPVRCLDCGAVIVPVNGWTHKYVGNDHIPVVEWPFAILAIEAEAPAPRRLLGAAARQAHRAHRPRSDRRSPVTTEPTGLRRHEPVVYAPATNQITLRCTCGALRAAVPEGGYMAHVIEAEARAATRTRRGTSEFCGCGREAYRPEPATPRRTAARCSGCHQITGYCKCAPPEPRWPSEAATVLDLLERGKTFDARAMLRAALREGGEQP